MEEDKPIKDLYHEVRELYDAPAFDLKMRKFLEKLKLESTKAKKSYLPECKEIIDDLNKVRGVSERNFEVTEKVITMIGYWLIKNKTVQDFKTVHRNKFAEWGKDPEWKKFLRPSTLYAREHFDEYLNQGINQGGKKGGVYTEQPKETDEW